MFMYSSAARVEVAIRVHSSVKGSELPEGFGAARTGSFGRGAAEVLEARSGRSARGRTAEVLATSAGARGGSDAGQCAQPDGGGARVEGACGVIGLQGGPEDRFEGRFVLLGLDRQTGRGRGAGPSPKSVLDQAVLTGMVGLHDDPATEDEAVQRFLEGAGQALELLVDGDPQRLEGALGGVTAA